MKKVGILGGAGFIGSPITKKFLGENFKVKVSTTEISNRSRYEHLYELENSANLEVSPLDLRHPESISAFTEGCDILIHGAPLSLPLKKEFKF